MMKRIGLLAMMVCGVAATTFLIAQENEKPVTVFEVKHVLTGRDREAFVGETSQVEVDTVTKLPIRTTVESPDGKSSFGYTEIRYFIPSPELMANDDVSSDAESIVVGPQATCRIRTAQNSQLLLDVTLTETTSSIHNLQEGAMAAETAQSRFVKPVDLGKPLTFAWPSSDEQTPPREITLTILGTK